MIEIWKDVPDYEGLYQASNLGRIKSLRKNIIMSQSIRNGYKQLNFYKNNKIKCLQVHRLVYETFNEKTDLHIDHILEGNKFDNRLCNLQAVSCRYNLSKSKMSKNKSSKYTGVNWSKSHNKWQSKIQIKSKTIHLGFHINELDASLAYQKALSEKGNSTTH
jgi:hypothetical protein